MFSIENAFNQVRWSVIKNPCKSLAWGVIVWRYAGDEPVVVFAHATIIHPKPKEESMLIIAIDLGKFNSVACIYNTQTQKQQFETLATDRGFFETLFKTYNPDLVVVEACGPSGWVSDLCADLNLEVIVCSTHEDAWMFKNVKRKTDYAMSNAYLLSRAQSPAQISRHFRPSNSMCQPKSGFTSTPTTNAHRCGPSSSVSSREIQT